MLGFMHCSVAAKATDSPRSATISRNCAPKASLPSSELPPLSTPPAGVLDLPHLPEALRTRLCPTHCRPAQPHQSRCPARIPKAIAARSPLSARHRRSRYPRTSRRPQSRVTSNLKREQNPRYRQHNGLTSGKWISDLQFFNHLPLLQVFRIEDGTSRTHGCRYDQAVID